MYEYFGVRRVGMDFGEEIGVCWFVPVCPRCGRFVTADLAASGSYQFSYAEGLKPQPNATCSRCGRVTMYDDGFE